MSGSTTNYNFGAKRHWRRWVWNRIAEAYEERGKVQDALVLYLPGATDFDRELALDRGFSPHNLIGIEKDKHALEQLRGRGILALRSDFLLAVAAASIDRKIDVVYGDFCCDWSPEISNKLVNLILFFHGVRNSVFAFNLLRGRGILTEEWKQGKKEWEEVHASAKRFASLDPRNRGTLMLYSAARGLYGKIAGLAKEEEDSATTTAKMIVDLMQASDAKYHSYRNTEKHQTFDTIVFKSPLRGLVPEDCRDKQDIELAKTLLDLFGKEHTRVRSSLAAVFAHRTRRIKEPHVRS